MRSTYTSKGQHCLISPGEPSDNLRKGVIMCIRDVSLLTLVSHNLGNSWVVYKGDSREKVVLNL